MIKIINIASKNIRYFRKLKGLTQEMLAEKVEVSTVYISYIERGTKVPSLDLLGKIADALAIDPALLLIQDNNLSNLEIKRLVGTLSNLDKPSFLFINEVINAFLKMNNSKL